MRFERFINRVSRRELSGPRDQQDMGVDLNIALTQLNQIRTRALMSLSAQAVIALIAVLSTSLSLSLALSDRLLLWLSGDLHTTLMTITLNGLLIALSGGLVALVFWIKRRLTLPRFAEQVERALEERELMPDASRGVISTIALTLEPHQTHRSPDLTMSALLARRATPALNLAARELFITPWRVLALILVYSGALSTHWLARTPELSSYLMFAPSVVDHDSLEGQLGELSGEQHISRGRSRGQVPPKRSHITSQETSQAVENARRDQHERAEIAQIRDQERDQERDQADHERPEQSKQSKPEQSERHRARERPRELSWGSRNHSEQSGSPSRPEPRRERVSRMSVGGQRTRGGQSVGSRPRSAARSMKLTRRDPLPREDDTRSVAARDYRGAQVVISERESAAIYGVAPQLTPTDFPPELGAYVNARAREVP